MHATTERSMGSFRNLALEDDKPTHLDTMPLDEKLEGKAVEKETSLANTAHGSNRALLVLVITMCLISLVVLLLTLLMLFGKIGNGCGCSTDEASSSLTKSLATISAKMKALEENTTSLKLGLMEHLVQFNNAYIKTEAGYNALRDDLDMTRSELLPITDNITLTLTSREKVIYHQTMTPRWLEAHASYINSNRSSTTEQLTFNAGSVRRAALLKVPMIPAGVFENSTMLTVRIVVANDVAIGTNENSDIFYGLSDGVSFVGVWNPDKGSYGTHAPCCGQEGLSGPTIKQVYGGGTCRRLKPSDTFYPGQFVITLKLDARESWGSCYNAHDGGFVMTQGYDKRLVLSKGLTLEVYKGSKNDRVGIKFIEVTVVDDL